MATLGAILSFAVDYVVPVSILVLIALNWIRTGNHRRGDEKNRMIDRKNQLLDKIELICLSVWRDDSPFSSNGVSRESCLVWNIEKTRLEYEDIQGYFGGKYDDAFSKIKNLRIESTLNIEKASNTSDEDRNAKMVKISHLISEIRKIPKKEI